MNLATDQARCVRDLSRQLANIVRSGQDTIADARQLIHMIREAEGWLLSARRFLDPEEAAP